MTGIAVFPALGYAQDVNLRVQGVVSAAEARSGAPLPVSFRLVADGEPLSATYELRIDPGGPPLVAGGPVAVPIGSPVRVDVVVPIPPGRTGLARVAVEVDAGVPETNLFDNRAEGPDLLLVPAPGPQVAAVRAPARASAGQTVAVEVDLANPGPPGTWDLSVGVGRAPWAAAGAELARSPVALASGTRTLRLDVPLPAGLGAGGWYLIAEIDPDGADPSLDPGGRFGRAAAPTVVERPELELVSARLPDAVLRRPYVAWLDALGGDGAHDVEVRSGLPPGVGYGQSSRRLSGTPTEAGTFAVEVQIRSAGRSVEREVELTVVPSNAALAVFTSTLPEGFVGRPYEARLVASGGAPPYEWTLADGRLPAGLRLDGASLVGRPEATGRTALTLRVQDAEEATRDVPLAVSVGRTPDLRIATRSLAFPVGETVNVPLEVVGGASPWTWRAESPPPEGLRVTEEGRLAGTPTRVGRWPTRVSVTDRAGVPDFALLDIDVEDPGTLRIRSEPVPALLTLELLEHVFEAEGGTPPYAWRPAAGTAPPEGFFLAPGPERGAPEGTAVLYGRGFDPVLAAFSVQVTDAVGRRDELPVAVVVDPVSASQVASGCRSGGTGSLGLGLFGLLGVRRARRRGRR